MSDLAANPDASRRSVRIADVTQELREDIEEMSARMGEESHWPRVDLSSFCAIASGAIGGWQAFLDHDFRLGVSAAALGLVPAVTDAFKRSQVDLSDRPIAYAALATRHLKPRQELH